VRHSMLGPVGTPELETPEKSRWFTPR